MYTSFSFPNYNTVEKFTPCFKPLKSHHGGTPATTAQGEKSKKAGPTVYLSGELTQSGGEKIRIKIHLSSRYKTTLF